ncbi:apolipoprotein Da, duplicate 1 [Salvelinus namaycush]|uniref:Apolipoprotein D n=1 Tax=Salvelinus namaycush TaxID=8040 RepID=A0A8U0P7F7_SALNM|nr:apolipoprotein D [Salvelinus alpinus]XP_023865368.1 apolipoprotein D [Salvelinus alpinus]XP_038819292.1 apolipoprotein Da, duplicate 1 [Salvelinus namaycush]
MTPLFALLLPLLLLPLVSAQVPHWGPCPEPAVQPAFSMKKFVGRWFEIAKLPAQFEKGKCIETNFSMKADQTIRVVSSEILKGELRTIEGTGVTEDLKNPAKLGISYSYVLPYSPYWIISTDYENSALIYSCTDVLRLFHMDFAWILGRTRTLPAATVDKAREIFTSSNIDVSRMVASRQQGCD